MEKPTQNGTCLRVQMMKFITVLFLYPPVTLYLTDTNNLLCTGFQAPSICVLPLG